MAKKNKQDAGGQVNPLGWMVTFSDLVTLLLTFFVLLISMSSMDVKAMQQAVGTFFTGGSGIMNYAESGSMEAINQIIEKPDALPTKMLLENQNLKDMIFDFKDADFQKLMALVDRDIEVISDERGLVIRLASYILFDEGGALVKAEYLPILTNVANVLRSTRHPISVEGHTDDSPLEGGGDSWAWELSLDRAMAVMNFFTNQEGLPEERFRVAGFGPSRPLVPNTTQMNRQKNRRIEIVLYKENFS